MSPIHPLCYVCGVVIGATHWHECIWADLPFYSTDLVSQQDLDWCNDFRAIVFNRAQQDAPFLSGVGRINEGLDRPNPPCNRASHYNDDPPAQTVEFFPIHPYTNAAEDAPIYGCPIHSHCWTFLGQRLGPIPDVQLGPLSNVLKIRWDDEDYGGAKRFAHTQWEGGSRSSTDSATFVTDPWNIPALNSMLSLCLSRGKKGRRTTEDLQETNGSGRRRFPKHLPQELKYLVLDCLGFDDVRNVLVALGWVVHESYCRSRFRSDLFFEVQRNPLSIFDWCALWRESESMLEKGSSRGLTNRQRIFEILKSIQSEFDQYLRLYHTNLVEHTPENWDAVFKSTKADELRNIAHAMEVPPTVQKIRFSFFRKGSVDSVLSGIEITPGVSTLGYINNAPSSSIVLKVNSVIHGCYVKLDQKGIRDIKLIYEEGNSGWNTGFRSADSSEGVLFHNDGERAFICGMMDAHQLTAIGSITKSHRKVICDHKFQAHRCLRPSVLWRPDVPPSIVNLNEDQYTGNGPFRPVISRRIHPVVYQPLRYTMFGGIHGELIGPLRSIKGYQAHPPCVDMEKEEYIEKIQVEDMTESVRPTKLKIITNRGQTLTVGKPGNTTEIRTSYLTAVSGEIIVGFYSSPHDFLQYPNPGQSAEDVVGFGIITTSLDSSKLTVAL